jgi:xanthine dehydrogenase YagS FAD-binding subunit
VNRFALANARTIFEATGAAAMTVAHAMTLPPEAMGREQASVVKAGGIDLLDLMKEGLLAPAKLINLKSVPGLDTVTQEDDGALRIGPMVTLAALADAPRLHERYVFLAEVFARLGFAANP